MSVHIYYSTSLRELAGKLADNLAADRMGTADPDPFVPAPVMVPNVNLKQWLQLQIADRRGVTANIEFPFFENGLWQALCAVEQNLPGIDANGQHKLRMMDRSLLHLSVLMWLRDRVEDADETITPFLTYLAADSARYRKLWQLSSQLTAVFTDYVYHRPAWIGSWYNNQPANCGPGDQHAPIEAAQRALFQGVLGPRGLRKQLETDTDSQYRLLAEYAHEVFNRLKVPPPAGTVLPLHIFGMSRISPIHADCLFRLGQFIDVNLYQFSVCCEFWEDIETTQQERFKQIRALRLDTEHPASTDAAVEEPPMPERPELDLDPLENPLLQAWGHAGRETLVLLGECEERWPEAQCETTWLPEGETVPPEGTSVLSRLQYRVRSRQRGEPVAPPDPSLQIVACPSIYREVEAVYNSIIQNVLDDEELKLTDIAVLVTDMATYKPVLEYVFDGGRQVPYNLVDSSAAMESIYGQAVLALLGLAAGDFTRKEVFQVILNPCFLAGVRACREDALQWLEWADKLGIYRTFGETPADDSSAPAPFTWEQGLKRLRFGRIMDPAGPAAATAETTESTEFYTFDGTAPYADMASSDSRSIGQFCAVIEALHTRLAPLRNGEFTIGQWRQRLVSLCEQFLGIPPERATESYVQRAMFSSLEQAEHFDALTAVDTRMPLPLLRELVKSALVDIPGRKGTYLSHGVSVASLRPMRPIPFKVVYVLGMQEGKFPGSSETTTLDLRRAGRPQRGDISLPDANRYLFLETMLATEGKLYVSYVSHNLQKDEEFFPCSIVKQLLSFMNDSLLTTSQTAIQLPLKGSSPQYLSTTTGGLPQSDVLVNFSRTDRIEAMADVTRRLAEPDAGGVQLPQGCSTDNFGATADGFLATAQVGYEPANLPAAQGPGVERINVQVLSKFLNNPIEAGLRRHLGIYDETEDSRALAEDEPFFSTFPADWEFETEVLEHYVRTFTHADDAIEAAALATADTEAYMNDRYHHGQQCSRFPNAVFGDLDRNVFTTLITERTRGSDSVKVSLASLLDDLQEQDPLCNVVIGAAATDTPSEWRRPALTLQVPVQGGNPIDVEVSGSLPFAWADRDDGHLCACLVITTKTKISSAQPTSHLFQPFLFLMIATAAGEIPAGAAFTVYLAHRKGVETFSYKALPQQEAQHWLQQLIGDFLGDGAMDLLPYALLTSNAPIHPWEDGTFTDEEQERYREQLAARIEDDLGSSWPQHQPPEIHPIANPIVPDDAFDKVRRRLRPILPRPDEAAGEEADG